MPEKKDRLFMVEEEDLETAYRTVLAPVQKV